MFYDKIKKRNKKIPYAKLTIIDTVTAIPNSPVINYKYNIIQIGHIY